MIELLNGLIIKINILLFCGCLGLLLSIVFGFLIYTMIKLSYEAYKILRKDFSDEQ